MEAGAACPVCGVDLVETRGIEVGNIFKLGTKYSGPLGARYLDDEGEEHPIQMGSYGFGVSRMLAAIAEHNNDDRGLVWPASIAPFDVHMVVLGAADEVRATADKLHQELSDAGIGLLYDDREESSGVKFADADLIGVPVRVTVSARSLKAGGIEVKRRSLGQDSAETVALDSAAETLEAMITG